MKNTPLMEKEITNHILYSLLKKEIISRRIYLKSLFFARDLESWLKFIVIHLVLFIAATVIALLAVKNYNNWHNYTDTYKISLFFGTAMGLFVIALFNDFETLLCEALVVTGLAFIFGYYFLQETEDMVSFAICAGISLLMVLLTKSFKIFVFWPALSGILYFKYFM